MYIIILALHVCQPEKSKEGKSECYGVVGRSDMLMDVFALCEIFVLWSLLFILMVSNFYCMFVIDLHTDNM